MPIDFGTRPPGDLDLLVLHSHGHGDHVVGDGQLGGRPDTTVVGADHAAVTGFLGLRDWPDGVAQVDLGGRVVDAIPSPGHDDAAVTWYDRFTGLLLTGDPSIPGGCTWSTGRPSPPRWTGCWPSPPTTRSATCSAATSR